MLMIIPVILLLCLQHQYCACQPAGRSQGAELYFRLLTGENEAAGENDDGSSNNNHHGGLRFFGGGKTSGKGGRRPVPSDDLPVDDLIESTDHIYDPRDSDVNEKLLRKQLGRLYDKNFMSIFDPKKGRNGIVNDEKLLNKNLIKFVHGRPKGKRPDFLRRLRTARVQNGRKIKLNATKRERRKFQKYMWSLTFCPVKYSWKYLGIRFWPSWVKKGSCTSKRSCSMPEGMTCQPSGSQHKTFLRWHCEDYSHRHACRWIPVQYPVITECSCKC